MFLEYKLGKSFLYASQKDMISMQKEGNKSKIYPRLLFFIPQTSDKIDMVKKNNLLLPNKSLAAHSLYSHKVYWSLKITHCMKKVGILQMVKGVLQVRNQIHFNENRIGTCSFPRLEGVNYDTISLI